MAETVVLRRIASYWSRSHTELGQVEAPLVQLLGREPRPSSPGLGDGRRPGPLLIPLPWPWPSTGPSGSSLSSGLASGSTGDGFGFGFVGLMRGRG